jgi:mycofactocin precursor
MIQPDAPDTEATASAVDATPAPATEPAPAADRALVEDDLLIEDVSIDGMCGVY